MRIAAALIIPALSLGPLLVSAQAQTTTHPATSTAKTAKPAAKPAAKTSTAKSQDTVPLTTDEQKTLYALGLSIYHSLAPFNLKPEELKILKQAMTDAADNKPAVDINVYGPKIQALQEGRAAELAKAQAVAGQEFLTKAAVEPGANKLPSGMIYKELTPGAGDSPKATDTVKVNYKGTFTDGKVFDSSNGNPVEFQLDHVIPCWTEGVQHMKVGGKAQLVCPANLAYGERGNRGIPGNSTLVFEVELVAITPATTPATPPAPGAPSK